ncbi:hypothetical protein QOT17_001851 [Balamuthia mandrillaris]
MQKLAEEFLRFIGEEGFQDGLMSDVTLRLPDHPDLSLHSLVLCPSGYFRAGLNFRLRSGQDANARPLVLDLDRNAFVGRVTPASVFECIKILYGLVDLNNEELLYRLCDPQHDAITCFSSPVEASSLSSSSSSAEAGSKRKREQQEGEEKEEQTGKRTQPSLYSLFETAVFLSLDWLTDFCVAQMLRYHLSKESKGANTLLLHEMYEKYGQQLPKLKEGFEENLTKLVVVFCEGLFHKHADHGHKDEEEAEEEEAAAAEEKEREGEDKEKERENATKKPRKGYVAGDDSVLHKNLLFRLPAELVVKAISKFPFLKRHEHKKYQILKAATEQGASGELNEGSSTNMDQKYQGPAINGRLHANPTGTSVVSGMTPEERSLWYGKKAPLRRVQLFGSMRGHSYSMMHRRSCTQSEGASVYIEPSEHPTLITLYNPIKMKRITISLSVKFIQPERSTKEEEEEEGLVLEQRQTKTLRRTHAMGSDTKEPDGSSKDENEEWHSKKTAD